MAHRHGGLSELEVAIGEGGLVRAAQGRVSKVTVKMLVMMVRMRRRKVRMMKRMVRRRR